MVRTRGLSGLRAVLATVKPSVVATNVLTAMAGFALAALGAASPLGRPFQTGAAVLAGVSLIVGGSCALNNWIDRDIDALMERTRERPTACGSMGRAKALGLGFGLLGLGLAILASAGPAPVLLAAAGSFVYLCLYSLWIKRRSPLSLLVGGISGAAPPLIGWAAVDPGLGGPALSLFALLLVWQQAHVRALALMRAGEYRAAGIPMAGMELAPSRSRLSILGWIAALLPFPYLIRPPLPAPLLACLPGIAWLALGLLLPGRRRPGAWPRAMFLASLAYLILVFTVLVGATAVLGGAASPSN